jgi:hypothetical protein
MGRLNEAPLNSLGKCRGMLEELPDQEANKREVWPMAGKQVKINRAPVLTLWSIVVAEHLGYDHAAAMTLGKAVAGLNAQSKGRRLGFSSLIGPIHPHPQHRAGSARYGQGPAD